MKSLRRQNVEVNAGSMADIAFLLLIFFLVTSVIPNDKGLHRKLPPPCPQNEDCSGNKTKERNILEVRINANDELLVENEMVSVEELKDIAKGFLDNNGDGTCDYCVGPQVTDLSENPNKAVISLVNDKMTTYKFYIKVQDEITKAYYELRDDYARDMIKKSTAELSSEELKQVKEAYPFILSEAEIKK